MCIRDRLKEFIDLHSTTTIERSIVRLFGVDGVDKNGIPLPNVVVDHVKSFGGLARGVSYWLGNASIALNKNPQEIAELIAEKKINLSKLKKNDDEEIKKVIDRWADDAIKRIVKVRKERERLIKKLGEGEKPLLYAIVATGNIYHDIIQAKSAVKNGADIIAVIRSTAQSLLDYVPYGATTEGYGGTYATQENFRIMRKALDEVGEEVGRYIRLVNYASGLCMPEISVMGAFERLDIMLNDSMYGILFRDINMKRTFTDQHFSRMVNAVGGIIINTGEDNYLTTSDAIEHAHTVLTSQFINEQLALLSLLPKKQIGLGHAFEINPDIKNGLLYEIAHALLVREIFKEEPIKYMPPTRFMTGNIFKGHAMDTMFNLVSVLTRQHIHLVGILTEAIHTPFMQDRHISLETAKYVMNNARDLAKEIEFKKNGFIERRANKVLDEAYRLLRKISKVGLMKAIEAGIFANIARPIDGGKGLDGVFVKDQDYYNPFLKKFEKAMKNEI